MVPLFKGLAFGSSEGEKTCYTITGWKEYQNENKLKNIKPKLTNDSIILVHHGNAYTLWSLNKLSEDAKTFINKNRPLTGGTQNAAITGWISGENKNLELKQPGNSKIDGTVKVEISKNKVTFNKNKAFSKVWIVELKVETCPPATTSPTTEAATTTTIITEAPTTTSSTEEITTTIPEIVAGDEDEKTTPTTTQPTEVVAGDEDEVDVVPTGENYLYRAVAILFILSGAVVLVPAIKKVRVKK